MNEFTEDSVAGLPHYSLDSIWVLTMVAGGTLPSLLEPYVTGATSQNAILKQAAKRAYTNGIGLIPLDESQFITAIKTMPKARVVQFAKGEKTLSALQNAGAGLLDQY